VDKSRSRVNYPVSRFPTLLASPLNPSSLSDQPPIHYHHPPIEARPAREGPLCRYETGLSAPPVQISRCLRCHSETIHLAADETLK
jgi:hypothetical protein